MPAMRQQPNKVWTKSIWLVEDHSANISKKTKKHFRQNICNEVAKMQIFIFPHYKSMELKLPYKPKYISNGNKNNVFLEANAMNISAKFQLYRSYSFWGVEVWNMFRKFSLSLAMKTNQIE